MSSLRDSLTLYLVMGSPNCKEDPRHVLREAIEGGVTLFQFREKGRGALVGPEKYQLAKDLQTICKEYDVPFYVNDDIDLAIELNADGVHIGQEDEPVEQVRKKIGNKVLGVSVHNLDEARSAIKHGADYLGVGPMYETSTKTDTRAVQGPLGIKQLREGGITLPIVGIGGISNTNAKDVMSAGADGVAVVSAISLADSPKQGAASILVEVN